MDQVRVTGPVGRRAAARRAAARRATALLLVATLGLLGGAQACRTVSSAPRTLAAAEPSPDALARRFLDCLAKDDLEGMKALRVTEDEFCAYVFPELPASKLNNVTCDWVWDQATLKSMAGMKRMLDGNHGRRYELVSLRFAATEEHDTYRVLKSPVATLRDESGQVQEVRLFGSMLEMEGQYKLFSFVVD